MALLDKAKMAMRITTNAYDDEITDLIEAAKADLGIAGVELPGTLDAICERAIIYDWCIAGGGYDLAGFTESTLRRMLDGLRAK